MNKSLGHSGDNFRTNVHIEQAISKGLFVGLKLAGVKNLKKCNFGSLEGEI